MAAAAGGAQAVAALAAAGQSANAAAAALAAAGQAVTASAAALAAAGQAVNAAAALGGHAQILIPGGPQGNNGVVAALPAGHQDAADNGAPPNNHEVPNPNAQARRIFRHPLSRQATIAFLKQSADASVMGLVTLSAFFATYLLAWGPAGSTCIPPKPGVKNVEPSWLQLWAQPLVAALPFLVFPLTLFMSGLVQAAEKDGHALGFLAVMCLTEFILAFGIGAGMMFCMSGWSQIWYVACPIIALMVVTAWGFTFKYPAVLRKFVWSTCCRQHDVVVQAGNQ